MPDHARIPGHSAPVSADEMRGRIAKFAELKPDLAAFPDLKDPARMRSVSYVISPDGTAGPAAITTPHNFHMAMLEMSKGVRPSTHAHPYNEIFMPLDAKFRLMCAGVESGDQLLQLYAVAFQHAECAFQAHGVEQGRREQDDQRQFEDPLHAEHSARPSLINHEQGHVRSPG